jgi:hypothetical protein
MGSNDPVIPAQLVEADFVRVEGTLVICRPIMFLGGARNLRRSAACLPGTPQEKRRFSFHKLLLASGKRFSLLNTCMSVIEIE